MKHLYVFLGSLGLIAIGVWMIIQPYAAHFTSDRLALWSSIIGGGLVVALGAWSAFDRRASDQPWQALRYAASTLGIIGVGVYTVIAVFAAMYESIGRFNAFYVMMVGMALIILGLSVFASRMGQAPSIQAVFDEGNRTPGVDDPRRTEQ
jgi:peptidoglycan/LPS O-acetylase OafA/YrhL